MFKQLSNLAQVMKQAQALHGKMADLKASLAQIRATGESSNGAVSVEVSGDQRVLSVRIDETRINLTAPRAIEFAVLEAVNSGLDRAKLAAAEAAMSAGSEIPGLSEAMNQFQ